MNSRFTYAAGHACCLLFLAALFLSGSAVEVKAQNRPTPASAEDSSFSYGSGFGGEVVLTNSGFGLGGYLRGAVTQTTSLAVEAHIVSGKDAREAAFFDIFGRRSIPEKYNYFLMMPVRAGVQQRLFREQIEDNFRPYVHVSFGPALGWAYPYFEDENDNGERDEGERIYGTFGALSRGKPHTGIGGLIAIGAHFGGGRATRSLRIGYDFNYFFDPVQLLQPDVKEAQHYFGTPTISLTFGRLW